MLSCFCIIDIVWNNHKLVFTLLSIQLPVQPLSFQALSATLLYYNRKFGLRASGVLFFFWFFLIIAGLSQLRSEIVDHANLPDDKNVQYSFVSYMVYYPLIVLMFVLNCFADLPPRDTPYKYEKVTWLDILLTLPNSYNVTFM